MSTSTEGAAINAGHLPISLSMQRRGLRWRIDMISGVPALLCFLCPGLACIGLGQAKLYPGIVLQDQCPAAAGLSQVLVKAGQ